MAGDVAGAVLVVDDESGPRDSLRVLLTPQFRVVTAQSGEQALDVLRSEHIDVVTLDLSMPGMGGMKCLEAIREMDADIEVIIVSATGSPDDRARAWRYRAFGWILKPFDGAGLIEVVERAAQRRIARTKTVGVAGNRFDRRESSLSS